MTKKSYTIAVYYFPNYHLDDRNALVHGPGWTEWELIKRSTPRYPGHYQPRQPDWGYEHEDDPQVMAKKIDAAADHGINVFLFDWYWYNDGPFLQNALEKGFLNADNNQRLDFAIHWANHDWIDIHPASLLNCSQNTHRLLYPGEVTRETFDTLTDHVIEHYFKHPAYWKINGMPYFSIYDLSSLLRSFNGTQGTREALDSFRQKTIDAGFPGLHLNQVVWNMGILPGETASQGPGSLLKELGMDSFTSYVWIHHANMAKFPETDYLAVFEAYLKYWEQAVQEIDLPYYPNATMGWDSSPRTIQSDKFLNAGYPFTPILSRNTPQRFQEALEEIKTRIEREQQPPIITVNAWNEWTEGSYLEPDSRYGMGYLKAIRHTFKTDEL